MNNTGLEQVIHEIKGHNSFLILVHDKPDGDAIGSSTALALFIKKLGKTAVILSPSDIPQRLHFLKDENVTYINYIDNVSNIENKISGYDYIISIDVASYELLGGICNSITRNIGLVIDHHKINTLEVKNKYVDKNASAAGEIVFSLIQVYSELEGKSYFDNSICKALFASVSSDTGCFRYGNTTSFTHMIASHLMSFEINTEEINRLLFDTKSYTQIKVEQLAYEKLNMYYNGKLAIVCIDISDLEKIGASEEDTETISQLARMIQGVSVGALMREKIYPDGKSGYKFSVRSNYEADVAELCSKFGGGGHKKAAGCSILTDKTSALEAFVKEAEKFII